LPPYINKFAEDFSSIALYIYTSIFESVFQSKTMHALPTTWAVGLRLS